MFRFISVLSLITFIFNQSVAQCPIAEMVKNNKPKISSPYLYDGFSVCNLNFSDKEKTSRAEFIALKGQTYKLHICTSGFAETVKVKVYYKHPKKDELVKVVETTVGGAQSYFLFEPSQFGTYYFDYEVPVTSETPHKDCVLMLISYK